MCFCLVKKRNEYFNCLNLIQVTFGGSLNTCWMGFIVHLPLTDVISLSNHIRSMKPMAAMS